MQSQIVRNLVWQRNFWSTMDFYICLCRFQKWLQMSSKSTLKSARSSPLRLTSNFCQSALLWPTWSTRRSKRCVLFPARQHQINPYSFDLPRNNFFSIRILLTYECVLCGLGQSNADHFEWTFLFHRHILILKTLIINSFEWTILKLMSVAF